MKNRRGRRDHWRRDILRDMDEARNRPLENELAVEAAMAARKIIECTANLSHEQRRVNAEWLKRYPQRD